LQTIGQSGLHSAIIQEFDATAPSRRTTCRASIPCQGGGPLVVPSRVQGL
jgi:hypothetical protein